MSDEVIGIDEVGRGCWAGPLVVGAVILSRNIKGLTDSKLLSKLHREVLAEAIEQQAIFAATGWVWSYEVDELGLTKATTLAIKRALKNAPSGYNIIIDGSFNYLPGNPKATTLVKADLTVPSVSAASVLAKVARDKYMAQQALLLPGYGFERHVGYGTMLHRTALVTLGVTSLHRKSYKPIQEVLKL